MLFRTTRSRALWSILAIASLSPLSLAVSETAAKSSTAPEGFATWLTADSFQKLLKVEERLGDRVPRDRNLEAAIALNGNSDSLETWLRRLESNPENTAAFRSSGVSAREYLRTLVALFRASAVVGFKKVGKPVPDALQQTVPAQSVAFVEGHWAEIDAWSRKTGTQGVQPNTIEDLYVSAEPPKSREKAKEKDAPKKP